jgi:HD superfamily phosphodiesterase
MELEKILHEGRRFLTEQPYDRAHDLNHSEAVWNNCQAIILSEGLLGINLEALMIASPWHDVQRSAPDECQILRETMEKAGAEPVFILEVENIIGEHSFGKKQTFIESKIFYDADKLEYLSIPRLQTIIKEYKEGIMSQERFIYYKTEWAKRINLVKGTLHFGYSHRRFKKDLEDIVAFMRETPLVSEMADLVVL